MTRYVISGEARCEVADGFAYLEMSSRFGNGGGDVARNAEPGKRFEGTRDWQPFEIACAGDYLEQSGASLDLSLKWQGSGTVSFRNVRLTEYAPTLPLTPLEQKQAVKWGWIGGGAGGAVGLLGGAAVVWQIRRRRRKSELRRMASLDTFVP